MGDTGRAQAAAEILEKLAVRGLPEIDTVAPAVRELALVLVGQQMPAVVVQRVVGKVFKLQRAFMTFSQVTKLIAELHAAVRQQAWG